MKKGLIISAAMVALMFMSGLTTGCKPTEQNYRAAYDAAQQKREEAVREQMLPATGMLSDEGPQLRIVEGDTVYVQRDLLYELEGGRVPQRWVAAVGVFKMNTNAKAGAEALKNQGYDAKALRGQGQKYYITIGAAETLDSIAALGRRFVKEHPGYPYIGFPGAPVMIGR